MLDAHPGQRIQIHGPSYGDRAGDPPKEPAMEEMIQGLIQKVGLDRATAEKVVAFVKEHAADLPKWLQSSDIGKQVMDKLPGGLGGFLK
jgi:hypothetical protein